jgi:ABC-type glycerol-3-phosphate transport system substrate-binding protein
LYVGSYNGGCGEEWVEAIGARFEETYADYSFEPGKKGVQVWYEHDKVNYLGSQALNSLTVTSRDVMFIQGADYPDFFDDNNATNLLEITDIVTGSLEDMGDTGTIEDKLSEDQKAYYKVNDKYYALPGYNGFLGVVYDVDLFDSKGLYFGEDGKLGASLSDKRACGPDGVVGTYDDGLPATYEDFHTLCDYMKKRSITPIIWTGQYRFPYSTYMMHALYVDYEGKDRAYLQYNAGSATNNVTDIVTSIANGVVTTEEVAITKDNFVQLAKQPGRYYALKVMEDIVTNKYYSSLSMDDAESHVMAQADFLESTMTNDKIAMIFEGSWWMSEANSVFEDMASINAKYSKENRRFGFLPMPKQSAEKFGKCTLADATQSMMIIPAKVEASKQECAKMFVKFANTQQSLQEFTVLTGGVRAMKCDYTDVMDQLTYWTKSLVDMKNNSDIVYSACVNKEAKNFVSTTGYTFAYSKVGTINENCAANAMVYRNVTAEQYFNGYYDYYNN